MFDLSGRIVRVVTFDGTSLDVGDLAAGSYFIRLKNKDKTGRIKFVKM
ncbi:MAG: T9SS type A sorting domain-containing protein [Saprospiraceae bacterium]|nr:T9SS type A sorting domain-containing protein [Saprospiraceae bacterium]